MRAARPEVVGVVVLGVITALGGGFIRDVLIDALPPATHLDRRSYTLAAAGGLIAFAVIGATKSPAAGLGVAPSVLLGVITAVGGGTIRDTLVGRVPTVLRTGLHAVPALVGAALTVLTVETGAYGLPCG